MVGRNERVDVKFDVERVYHSELAKLEKNEKALNTRVKTMKSKKDKKISHEVFKAIKGYFTKKKPTKEAIKFIAPELTEEEIEQRFLGPKFSDKAQQKTWNIQRIHRYITDPEIVSDVDRQKRILTLQLDNLSKNTQKLEWSSVKLIKPQDGRFTGSETHESRLEKTRSILNYMKENVPTPHLEMVGKAKVAKEYSLFAFNLSFNEGRSSSSIVMYLACKLEKPFVYYRFEKTPKKSSTLNDIIEEILTNFSKSLAFEDFQPFALKAKNLDLVSATSSKIATPVRIEKFNENFDKKKIECGWEHLNKRQVEELKAKEYVGEMFSQGEKSIAVSTFSAEYKGEDGKVQAKFSFQSDRPYDVVLKEFYAAGAIGDPLPYIAACRSNENTIVFKNDSDNLANDSS